MTPRDIQLLREQIAMAIELAKQTRDHRTKRIRRGYGSQLVKELKEIDAKLLAGYHDTFNEK